MDENDQVVSQEGRARRRFLKQAATVAWGAPLVVTMMSRAAQAQGTVCGEYVVNPDPTLPFATCITFAACGSATSCQPTSQVSGSDCTCQ